MKLYKSFRLQEYFVRNTYQYFEMFIYSIICFFMPLFIGHPQIVVGITVNTMLILSALNLRNYKLLPIIILPSIGVLSRGLIFGPFTIFLLYMIPFIWIANTILIFSIKLFKLKLKLNYWISLIISILLKSGFLFMSAFILFKLNLIPIMFLTAFGIIQIITAFAGGTAAYSIHNIKKKLTL